MFFSISTSIFLIRKHNGRELPMDARHRRVSVLMLPWLAHGHISPFLELAKRLTKRNFHIYFCSTSVNLTSIKKQLSEKYSSSIELVELSLPSLSELPPHYHTTNGLPPHLMPTLKRAFDMAGPSYYVILKTLNPDVVVYDFLQPWAPSVALSENIPAVEFFTSSTVMAAFVMNALDGPKAKLPISDICLQEYDVSLLHRLLQSSSNDINDKERFVQCSVKSCDIVLVKTFREIEEKYLDYLSELMEKKIVPVGPLVQDELLEDTETEVLEWLDKKGTSSTIFVSFGSEYFLSKKKIEEIAHGLELSGVNFIWVLRFPAGENVVAEETLPEGFTERVRERGLIVEGWAQQVKILGHSSTGGFLSHCGWSSVMESMKFGVPIIAIPMHLDQPVNAKLVEELGVGIEIRRDENGGFDRMEIAKAIREVVVERDGERVRKKAREMEDVINRKGDEEIDKVVQELVKLSRKNEFQNAQIVHV